MDTERYFTGALEDTRTPEQKERDIMIEETVARAAAVNLTEKEPNEWRRYPTQQQDGSGSCVAQTMKKLISVNRWLQDGGKKDTPYTEVSATSIYSRRSNKPASGMIGIEAFDIAAKYGATLESRLPSTNMNDAQMDAIMETPGDAEIAKAFRIGGHVGFTPGDFQTVVSTILTTGKPVMVWYKFENLAEWTEEPRVISTKPLEQIANQHSVTATDAILWNGQPRLVIEDSWGPAGPWNGAKLISPDFHAKRNTFARYVQNLRNVPDDRPEKPRAIPDVELIYGMRNSEAVRILQDALKWEGSMPTNIDSTGNYLALTARAIRTFETKHGLAISDGKKLNPDTRAWLNIQLK
jgi:hypothetical protein